LGLEGLVAGGGSGGGKGKGAKVRVKEAGRSMGGKRTVCLR
jgi:hypothetical protein